MPEVCFSKFRKKIPEVVTATGLKVGELYSILGQEFPECKTSAPYVWKGKKSGLKWKHDVREALYYLRKNGQLKHFGGKWYHEGFDPLVPDQLQVDLLLTEYNKVKSKEEIVMALNKITQTSEEFITVSGKKLKRDYDTINKLKFLRDFKCQICGTTISKRGGSRYIEAAHITEKRYKGPELPSNILILCPNHHKEFDYGNREIISRGPDHVKFSLNGKEYDIPLLY